MLIWHLQPAGMSPKKIELFSAQVEERNQAAGLIMEKSAADINFVQTRCKFMFPGEGLNSWWHSWDN